jgi:hypothetical protein
MPRMRGPLGVWSALLSVLVAGCASSGRAGAIGPTPAVDDLRLRLAEIEPATFAAQYAALGKGQGTIQPNKVRYYTVHTPFRVYRVYSKASPKAAMGSWWTPDAPTGTKPDYRRHYEICTDWNQDMDMLVSCNLKKGTVIAVGPGAGVDGRLFPNLHCSGEVYPPDIGDHLQILVAPPVSDKVEQCDERPLSWEGTAPAPSP